MTVPALPGDIYLSLSVSLFDALVSDYRITAAPISGTPAGRYARVKAIRHFCLTGGGTQSTLDAITALNLYWILCEGANRDVQSVKEPAIPTQPALDRYNHGCVRCSWETNCSLLPVAVVDSWERVFVDEVILYWSLDTMPGLGRYAGPCHDTSVESRGSPFLRVMRSEAVLGSRTPGPSKMTSTSHACYYLFSHTGRYCVTVTANVTYPQVTGSATQRPTQELLVWRAAVWYSFSC